MSEQPRKIKRSTSSRPAAQQGATPRSAKSSVQATRVAQSSANATRQPSKKAARKRKKRLPLWLPLLIVLVIIVGAGLYVWNYVNGIMEQITPEVDTPEIAEEIKTAEAYSKDVVGLLLCGIDYSGEGVGTADGTNDGLTDMIMYMQFDVKNNKMNLLQIPRNTYVGLKITCDNTTGNTYNAWNGQINSIVRSNKNDSGQGSMAALADVVANNYNVTIDYYASIDMEALKELITRFGGIEVYIPKTIKGDGDSVLEEGYRILDADAAEFFLRERHSYADSDLGRLNAQRYFYEGLFNRLMTCSIPEIIKLMPVVTYFVQTDCDFSTLVSLGVSFLKLDAANIMLCQAPTSGGTENIVLNDGVTEQSVIVANKEATAALLNTYFSAYSGPITVDDLHTAEWPNSGIVSDPNVQYLGQITTSIDEAVANGAKDDVSHNK